jgi:acyl-coenzyme A thioesterase PaaI-like protein
VPRAAATRGFEFIGADVEKGTIEVAFSPTEAFTNPTGNVLGPSGPPCSRTPLLQPCWPRSSPTSFSRCRAPRELPAPRPGRVVAKGRVVHRNGDLAFLEASLFDRQEFLIAAATATARVIALD